MLKRLIINSDSNYKPIKKAKITSGTKEWADSNVNCITGCSNNCRYCYAKKIAIRFGKATEESWPIMKIRRELVKKKYLKRNGRIMFPSSHDITPHSEIKEACLTVLEKLLESGNNVLITSKPSYVVISEICERFNKFKNAIQFRFTITSLNNNLLSFWEPGAPLFEERLRALQRAFNSGYKTSVSIEPFLDADPITLINKIEPWVSESIWLGRMNYIKRSNLTCSESEQYASIRINYQVKNIIRIINGLENNKKVKFKDSIRRLFFER